MKQLRTVIDDVIIDKNNYIDLNLSGIESILGGFVLNTNQELVGVVTSISENGYVLTNISDIINVLFE